MIRTWWLIQCRGGGFIMCQPELPFLEFLFLYVSRPVSRRRHPVGELEEGRCERERPLDWGGSNAFMVDVSKPKSKPVTALRLWNQDTKDSRSQTAKQALSHSQPKNYLFFAFGIFTLISFPGSCWQSVPNHCLIRTDTRSNTLLTYSICLTLSFSKVKQHHFVAHTPCHVPAGSSPHRVRQWLLHHPLDTLQLPPLPVQLRGAACWLGQIPIPTRSEVTKSGVGFSLSRGVPSRASELQVALILPL